MQASPLGACLQPLLARLASWGVRLPLPPPVPWHPAAGACAGMHAEHQRPGLAWHAGCNGSKQHTRGTRRLKKVHHVCRLHGSRIATSL